MADVSRNSFQPNAGYRKVIWQQTRALLDFDFNELGDLMLQLVDLVAAQAVDGATLLGNGGALSPGAGARQVNIAAGIAVHNGTVVRIPAGTLQVFNTGTVSGIHSSAVYVDWTDEEITHTTDATFFDTTFGYSTVRQKRTVTVEVNIGSTSVPAPAANHYRFLLAIVTHDFAGGTTILQSDIAPEVTALSGGELAGASAVQRTVKLASNAAAALDGWQIDTKRTLTGAHTKWRNNGTDLMTLLGSGNLGLGISPTQKLHVSGNALVTGSVTAASLVGTTGSISGALAVGGDLTFPRAVGAPALASSAALELKVAGDSQSRLLAQADGKLWWGSGGLAQDTNLYRSTANTLKTDDSLIVDGGLTVQGAITAVTSLSAATASVTGAIAASTFTGGGSGLTALNASNLASGTVPDARVAASSVTQHQSALALSALQITAGLLPVARGGTGVSTLTGVLVGNGTSPFSSLSPGGPALFLRSTGAGTFAWQALQISDVGAHDLLGHTLSGATSGHALKATSATTYAFAAVDWSELANKPATFAPASHNLLGHTVSGLTTGQFLKATGATSYGFSAVDWADLTGKPSTFAPSAHDFISSHTASGLTAGHVVRATGASTFAFGALQAGDLPVHSHSWSQISATPTTRAGYGITDAAASVHSHNASDNAAGTFGAGNFVFQANLSIGGQVWSTRFDIGNVSGTLTVNWNNGNQQRCRLTGNVTSVVFQNIQPGAAMTLEVEQSTGGHTITGWPSNVRWPDNVNPTQSTAASRCDVYTFLWNSNNSRALGIESGTNYTLA